MGVNCQHCGYSLPPVVDAYCPECRNPLDEEPIEPRISSLPATEPRPGAEPTPSGTGVWGTPVAARTERWGWEMFGVLAIISLMLVAAGTNVNVEARVGPYVTMGLRGFSGMAACCACFALAVAKGRSPAWSLSALACYAGLVIVPLLPPQNHPRPPGRSLN